MFRQLAFLCTYTCAQVWRKCRTYASTRTLLQMFTQLHPAFTAVFAAPLFILGMFIPVVAVEWTHMAHFHSFLSAHPYLHWVALGFWIGGMGLFAYLEIKAHRQQQRVFLETFIEDPKIDNIRDILGFFLLASFSIVFGILLVWMGISWLAHLFTKSIPQKYNAFVDEHQSEIEQKQFKSHLPKSGKGKSTKRL